MDYTNNHEGDAEEWLEELETDTDDDEVSTACTCHSCSSGGDDCASQM
jgi:hypothetical protein